MNGHALQMNKEEFYEKTDSCYLRIQYIGDTDTFRIIMRNEALLSKEVEEPKGQMVGSIARGMLELAYSDPSYVHSLGKRCIIQDIMQASIEDLTDEQKEAWLSEPESKSIN